MKGTPLLERLDALDRRLLDDFQSGIPLAPRPFAGWRSTGRDGGRGHRPSATPDRGRRRQPGGPGLPPSPGGCQHPGGHGRAPERLAEVASLVNGFAEVNHNYEREHDFNLWFVLTAPDQTRLERVLDEIGRRTGLPVLDLPMLAEYHIDLGFPLQWT